MNDLLVSCVMPTTAHRSHFHPRARAMFEAQEWANKELVIIDGPETLGVKLNEGARIAKGEIIVNWDDDDFNAKDRISQQVAHLRLSGKPAVGMSSLLFYKEGLDYGWEYTGDASYAPGSSHCYMREYVLSHPRPDMTSGEDVVWAQEAHARGDISTISGSISLVACDHPGNTCPRDTEMMELMREASYQYRKIPLSAFALTVTPYLL